MSTSKQEIIDEFGHYFVLCGRTNRDNPNDPESPAYVSPVFSDMKNYENMSSFNRPYDSLVIYEIFGKPQFSDTKDSSGIVNNPNFDARNTSVFETLEDAEKQAKAVKSAINRGLKALKKKAARIPVNVELQPDELPFDSPVEYKTGAPVYVVTRPTPTQKIQIFKVDVYGSELSAYSTERMGVDENGNLGVSYQQKFRLWIPVDDTSLTGEEITRHLGKDGKWGYYNLPRTRRHKDGFFVFSSADRAMEIAEIMAKAAVENALDYLSPEFRKAAGQCIRTERKIIVAPGPR